MTDICCISPAVLGAALVIAPLLGLAEEEAKHAVPAAFESFRPLIGQWRGTGQVRRGSTRGAWQETAEWRYEFGEDRPRLVLDVSDGNHVDRLVLRAKNAGLAAELVDIEGNSTPLSVEKADDKKVVFVEGGEDTSRRRLTLTTLNEKRTLLLIESARAGSDRFRRVAEVGYTREGTRLAGDSAGGPECIVTGGKGTIQVSYQGKTYYVCCTGCKQAFEADPEAILADAAERAAKP